MRIVFSRKGFDSGSGGAPSPILSGKPVSLPIPTTHRSHTSYEQLGLGDVVEQQTRGRIGRDHLCHEDPMFFDNFCVFGQTSAAQSHLYRQGVGVNDVFLFFGLFADESSGEKHHRIFGFLKVDKVLHLGANPTLNSCPVELPRQHPHTIGHWNINNTIYLGEGATSRSASQNLRLTQLSGPPSIWLIPSWLTTSGLTYHQKEERWLANNRLQVVARGQEFVTEVGNLSRPKKWLEKIIKEIRG